jgi:hypothetical protein
VDHQVDKSEPQEDSGGDAAPWARDGMPRRRHGEGVCLASCRLSDGSDWIIAELITRELPASLIASNACQQQRGESIPNHNVLNQLPYRDLRRVGPAQQSAGSCCTTRSNSADAA